MDDKILNAEQIKAEFARRKLRQKRVLITLLPFVLVLVAIKWEWLPIRLSQNWIGGLFLVIVIIAMTFSGLNYRCPNCGAYLALKQEGKVCGKCQAELK
ncbi:MAG: hypothetical protein ACM3QZ_00430 [Solirubrobacterales bacterium]